MLVIIVTMRDEISNRISDLTDRLDRQRSVEADLEIARQKIQAVEQRLLELEIKYGSLDETPMLALMATLR